MTPRPLTLTKMRHIIPVDIGSGRKELTFSITRVRNMLANVTVADLFRPCEKSKAWFYDSAVVIGGSLLIALCAQLAVGQPVPITGQTFGVLIVGALLGSRRGGASVLVYIIEGLAGLPVFAQGKAGFATLTGPTGGYLVGFIVAAFVVGWLAERGWDRRIVTTVMAMVLGNITLYAFGLFWLTWLVRFYGFPVDGKGVLAMGLYPFLIGDLVKIALAAVLLPSGWKLLGLCGFAQKRIP
jgi:biotin transport system substrate-specific component